MDATDQSLEGRGVSAAGDDVSGNRLVGRIPSSNSVYAEASEQPVEVVSATRLMDGAGGVLDASRASQQDKNVEYRWSDRYHQDRSRCCKFWLLSYCMIALLCATETGVLYLCDLQTARLVGGIVGVFALWWMLDWLRPCSRRPRSAGNRQTVYFLIIYVFALILGFALGAEVGRCLSEYVHTEMATDWTAVSASAAPAAVAGMPPDVTIGALISANKAPGAIRFDEKSLCVPAKGARYVGDAWNPSYETPHPVCVSPVLSQLSQTAVAYWVVTSGDPDCLPAPPCTDCQHVLLMNAPHNALEAVHVAERKNGLHSLPSAAFLLQVSSAEDLQNKRLHEALVTVLVGFLAFPVLVWVIMVPTLCSRRPRFVLSAVYGPIQDWMLDMERVPVSTPVNEPAGEAAVMI